VNNNGICVITATDEDYFIPTEIMLRSLDFNYKNKNKLDVYVLVNKELSLKKFKTVYKNLNVNLINAPKFESEETLSVAHRIYHLRGKSRLNISSMYRFFMADIIKNYDKAVYIDSDCLVVRDISPLLGYNLRTPLAAFPEIQLELADNLEFKDYSHFNSGVMVVDLLYWRNHGVGKTLVETAKTFDSWAYGYDQDILNAVFKENWSPIPASFNYLINIYKNLEVTDPLIVHWAGKTKPWLSNCPDTKWKAMWNHYKAQGPTTT